MLIDQYRPLLKRNSNGGGLSVHSIAAWRFLFDCQRDFGISGDMIEIGVWHGVGVAAMRMHAEKGETVCGYDIGLQSGEIDETLTSVLGGSAGVKLVETDSTQLRKIYPAGSHGRFIHIDGEHSYSAVRSDLELAEHILCEGGIVAVDDFFSMPSACITQAVFDALAARPFALRMFLAGANKAYLSTPKFFARYRRAVLERFSEFAYDEFGLSLTLAKNGHGTEIDYVTFFERFDTYKGMQISEWLDDVPKPF